jgi:hypothetical protein
VSQEIRQRATDGLSHPDRTLILSVPTTPSILSLPRIINSAFLRPAILHKLRLYSPCHRTYSTCIINSVFLRPAILHNFRLYSPCHRTYTTCIINSVFLRPAILHNFRLYSPCHRTYTTCIINSVFLRPAILYKFRLYSPCHRTYTVCINNSAFLHQASAHNSAVNISADRLAATTFQCEFSSSSARAAVYLVYVVPTFINTPLNLYGPLPQHKKISKDTRKYTEKEHSSTWKKRL